MSILFFTWYRPGNPAFVNTDNVRVVVVVGLDNILTFATVVLVVVEPCRWVVVIFIVVIVVFQIRVRGLIVPVAPLVRGANKEC